MGRHPHGCPTRWTAQQRQRVSPEPSPVAPQGLRWSRRGGGGHEERIRRSDCGSISITLSSADVHPNNDAAAREPGSRHARPGTSGCVNPCATGVRGSFATRAMTEVSHRAFALRNRLRPTRCPLSGRSVGPRLTVLRAGVDSGALIAAPGVRHVSWRSGTGRCRRYCWLVGSDVIGQTIWPILEGVCRVRRTRPLQCGGSP